jgi:hypothetical protein
MAVDISSSIDSTGCEIAFVNLVLRNHPFIKRPERIGERSDLCQRERYVRHRRPYEATGVEVSLSPFMHCVGESKLFSFWLLLLIEQEP